MRKKNQEITDRNIIDNILSGATVCRVAMTDGDVPYLLPFNYGYKANTIYIHAATKGKKIDLLRKNKRVCFEVEDESAILKYDKACDWSAFYRSVVGYGDVEIITDFDKKQAGLDIIMAHNGAQGKMGYERKHIDAMVILKLNITSLSGKQSGNRNRIIDENRYETESDRLFLKEVGMDDLEAIHKLESIPEVDEFNTQGIPEHIAETQTMVIEILKEQDNPDRKSYTWKIVLKETNAFIGLAGLTLSKDKFRLGEIYYKLLPAFWGKGYATEVSRTLIKAGFHDFKLHKVEAGVATENLKSIRVLEKSGMKREGLRRKILPIRGDWKDNYHYAIVEDDVSDYFLQPRS